MSITFAVVLLARLAVPLAIPRYPLPAVLAALVIDAADQTIFQHLGGLPADYQSYDKALDIYYLVIAYASTLRNWQDPVAFQVGRGLWYYRLIGVVAFELSGQRALLLIFPNTFEYFFIAYEVVRVWWNPLRLRPRAVIGLAAGIWIFIKLPQEWWIHIAQLDVTDELGRHRWVLPVLIALLVLVLLAVLRLWPRLPARDWAPTVRVDDHLPARAHQAPTPAAIVSVPFAATVLEKVLLLGLIAVIFAKVLHVSSTHTQIVAAVTTLVVINAALSQAFARRGTAWSTTMSQFAAMAGVNAILVLAFVLRRAHIGADVDPGKALAFLLLLSLIITLYDRYRTMREASQQVAAGLPLRPAGRPVIR
jgi:hypothetical protein